MFKLHFDNQILEGVFVYDSDFGSFFITKWSTVDLPFLGINHFKVSDNDLYMIINEEANYKIYSLKDEDKFMYLFVNQHDEKIEGIEYLSFEDFSNKVEDISNVSFKALLASVTHLPNGNYVIGNVGDYIKAIEELKRKYPLCEAFYRGHYSYKYTLVPSLYRKKKYYDNESYMYMDFKTQFYNELSNKKYIEILTTMQHYKMPTRLLDTTSNPLVALFMACDKPQNYKNKGLGVGEVVVMNEAIRNVKYSDSNATTLLSSLAVLETNYKQELYEKILESKEKNDPSIYKNSIAYKRFVAEVQNELPYFDDTFFTPDVLLRPRHVKVGMINERIIAQSGSFILFGLCNYVTGEYQHLNTVSKERIFIVHKEYIEEQLNMLNINSGTMYPDKDHISVSIMKSYE